MTENGNEPPVVTRDHVRVANLPSGQYRLYCLHCGVHYTPSLPCSVDMFLAMSNQFQEEHRDCPPNPNAPTEAEILARFDRGSL